MAQKYSEEFRRDAVRMALTSGLTRPQLSSDLGARSERNGIPS
jgi:transposase